LLYNSLMIKNTISVIFIVDIVTYKNTNDYKEVLIMKPIIKSNIAVNKSMEKAKNIKEKSKIKYTESIGRQGNLKKKKKGK